MKTLVLGLKICLRKISILFVKEYYSELLTAVCRAPFSRHPATGGRQIGKNGVCTCSNRRVGGCRLHAFRRKVVQNFYPSRLPHPGIAATDSRTMLAPRESKRI